ncbi:hypothetical protein [Mycolicibacterium hodleri]|uniref:Integral membrane protein n=1 Tax=Mycolicibacterium hodleri TaxID=49897 RepID=A0A502EHD2_9MYCO|nr:hypothetical protein [Mycolicibacterium hodleri]TPG35906.1 hypothetical protein EAH80_07710 [Mycolicibacterium hodleri]
MTATSATTAPASTRDALLRFALRLDAIVSGIVGIVGIAMAPRIAEMSGTTATLEYSIGAFFIAYGVAVLGLSLRESVRTAGLVIAVGNAVFTVAAIAVVLAGVWPLTTVGIVLTLGSGVFTLVMADLQYLGLRKL